MHLLLYLYHIVSAAPGRPLVDCAISPTHRVKLHIGTLHQGEFKWKNVSWKSNYNRSFGHQRSVFFFLTVGPFKMRQKQFPDHWIPHCCFHAPDDIILSLQMAASPHAWPCYLRSRASGSCGVLHVSTAPDQVHVPSKQVFVTWFLRCFMCWRWRWNRNESAQSDWGKCRQMLRLGWWGRASSLPPCGRTMNEPRQRRTSSINFLEV